MCNGKVVHIRCYLSSLGKTVERGFKKPPGLESWCPNCDKERNTERSIAFDRYVLEELFNENCGLIKEVMDLDVTNKDEWISKMPSEPDEIWDKMEELLTFNASLRGKLAAKLAAEEQVDRWEAVVITAPFMNGRAKMNLKGRLRLMADPKQIREYLSKRYRVAALSAKKGRLSVTLALLDAPAQRAECNICFDAPVCSATACTTCKEPKMCSSCEMDTLNRFGRCPFCNV